jgi:hypothetical protein
MQVLDEQGADGVIRVERLQECVADDQQGDHRDEQVHADYQGQVLALDLFEPPGRLQQEPHLPVPLEPLLILPQLLLRAGDPRWTPPAPDAAPFVRRVLLAQFSLGVSPPRGTRRHLVLRWAALAGS